MMIDQLSPNRYNFFYVLKSLYKITIHSINSTYRKFKKKWKMQDNRSLTICYRFYIYITKAHLPNLCLQKWAIE